ncbi:hypothetical protein EVAR_34659_1 [Eumeta japonica]|uniref:Uncharacterized protein n=1 Tax=Eumeta variegata TaxID=151549 RepID=A0A4C1VH02_EUMVA|nr:hypothetical protein EVAR_34659_1 [Eumeta japonica]
MQLDWRICRHIYLRDKGKWNVVSAECNNRLHINYASARNTLHGIKITVYSISDFRSFSSLLISATSSFTLMRSEKSAKSRRMYCQGCFQMPPKVCGLNGITVEAPYKKSARNPQEIRSPKPVKDNP